MTSCFRFPTDIENEFSVYKKNYINREFMIFLDGTSPDQFMTLVYLEHELRPKKIHVVLTKRFVDLSVQGDLNINNISKISPFFEYTYYAAIKYARNYSSTDKTLQDKVNEQKIDSSFIYYISLIRLLYFLDNLPNKYSQIYIYVDYKRDLQNTVTIAPYPDWLQPFLNEESSQNIMNTFISSDRMGRIEQLNTLCQTFAEQIKDRPYAELLQKQEGEESYFTSHKNILERIISKANPNDPTNPTNPNDPTNPTNPNDPTNPTNPNDTKNPKNPTFNIIIRSFDALNLPENKESDIIGQPIDYMILTNFSNEFFTLVKDFNLKITNVLMTEKNLFNTCDSSILDNLADNFQIRYNQSIIKHSFDIISESDIDNLLYFPKCYNMFQLHIQKVYTKQVDGIPYTFINLGDLKKPTGLVIKIPTFFYDFFKYSKITKLLEDNMIQEPDLLELESLLPVIFFVTTTELFKTESISDFILNRDDTIVSYCDDFFQKEMYIIKLETISLSRKSKILMNIFDIKTEKNTENTQNNDQDVNQNMTQEGGSDIYKYKYLKYKKKYSNLKHRKLK